MNIKEQESQLSFNLNLRIVISIIAYFALTGFGGYRLYLASRLPGSPLLLGVVVPHLKISNFEELSAPPKATDSGTGVLPVVDKEPFD